jgi:hypothetical protein
MSVEEANQILSALEAKLAAASGRAIELQTLRRKLSYAANTGDHKARKALDDANASSATADLEIENVKSAIEAARHHRSEAEREAEKARLAGNAERGREIGASFAARQRRIDAALAIVAEESRGSLAEINELHLLGLASPRAEQYKVLGESAISSALMDTPVKLRHLAPRERRTFTEIGDGWRLQIENWAAPFLEKANAEAA